MSRIASIFMTLAITGCASAPVALVALPPAPAAETAPEAPAPDGVPAGNPNNQSAPVESKPAFDPASLPSLDSIGALTDIRAFLQPGVPSELRLAALRRAWSADPAIRDFKGLAENDWDFTAPNSMLGFGDLDPSIDVSVGDLFGVRTLRDTYFGFGVSHRSGIFGASQLFGNVNGGSNYIYSYIESKM